MKGTCLCGAVTITVAVHEGVASACHCSMCRRWTGAALWCLEAPENAVTVTGPVKSFRSSAFADRAWCDTCGTHLWVKSDGEDYDLTPGLFDGARDVPLDRELYVEDAFAAVPLAGDHKRVSATNYEARNPFVEGRS